MKLLADAEGDPEELARYQALAEYPAGTLGRAFHDFYAQFDWPLPGDPLWISEDLTVRHDLVHVLCDYDISINGEFQVSAFTAGNSERFDCVLMFVDISGFTALSERLAAAGADGSERLMVYLNHYFDRIIGVVWAAGGGGVSIGDRGFPTGGGPALPDRMHLPVFNLSAFPRELQPAGLDGHGGVRTVAAQRRPAGGRLGGAGPIGKPDRAGRISPRCTRSSTSRRCRRMPREDGWRLAKGVSHHSWRGFPFAVSPGCDRRRRRPPGPRAG